MFRYIVRRLGIMIPTLLVISFLVFVVIQPPPGDYLSTYIDGAAEPGRGGRSRADRRDPRRNTASTSPSWCNT